MVNHGISTGALFLCVGILYERSHSRMIADYGGVSAKMPVFSAFFLIAILSSMGLPGLNGFVGEILCFFGIFAAGKTLAFLAILTVILSAAYLLGLFRKVMQGPVVQERVSSFKDLDGRELSYIIPLIILMFGLGLAPGPVLRKMDASVKAHMLLIRGRSGGSPEAGLPAGVAVPGRSDPFRGKDQAR
ncbi:MAG: nuoM, partial [Candidatus Aminicenantes bacterium]|nr:nuoM [Candidatus Aminicenantes bacterium]